ncbi:hypothetical protein LOTGIDRAFT_159319 [Lottia gigantea]|uniref:Uncharacterized protein n=1 Tax=Lottia gigantea TaxID=225164 RepID=V4AJK6_LOTGI|nr:hypothetical protein LOTGIDRAFT_159319 [Lottia gigantea]ESO97297.1 hypothetical protein LOTGIDRAFT_159319 [Lottia gigantea]
MGSVGNSHAERRPNNQDVIFIIQGRPNIQDVIFIIQGRPNNQDAIFIIQGRPNNQDEIFIIQGRPNNQDAIFIIQGRPNNQDEIFIIQGRPNNQDVIFIIQGRPNNQDGILIIKFLKSKLTVKKSNTAGLDVNKKRYFFKSGCSWSFFSESVSVLSTHSYLFQSVYSLQIHIVRGINSRVVAGKLPRPCDWCKLVPTQEAYLLDYNDNKNGYAYWETTCSLFPIFIRNLG